MVRFLSILFCSLAAMGLVAFSAASLAQSRAANARPPAATACIPAWNAFGASGELPSTVHSSIRASDGFVYIGGRDGLYRIEGGSARSWTPDFSNEKALPAGRVEALAEYDGALFVGTGAGLARLDLASEIFTRIALPLGANGRQNVRALAVHKGTLFIGTQSGVYSFSAKAQGTPHLIETDDGEPFKEVRAIASQDERLLVATDRGLFGYSGGNNLRLLYTPTHPGGVFGLASDKQGQVWAITSQSILAPDESSSEQWDVLDRRLRPGLPASELTALAFDQLGHLWVGSRDGLSRSVDGGERFFPCRRSVEATRDEGFSIGHLNGRLGPFLFLGSFGRGATVASLETNVRRIVPGEQFNPGLPEAPIWSTAKMADGRLLAGTTQGLFVESTAFSDTFRPLGASVMSDSRIFAIAPRGGEVWAGTNKGLVRIDASGKASQVPLVQDAKGPVVTRVFTLRHDGPRTLLGTSSGLIVLESETGKPVQFYRTNEEHSVVSAATTRELEGNRVWSLDMDGDTVFATGDTGSWAIDLARREVVASTTDAIAKGRFNAGRIYSILNTGNGKLLLGTEAGLVETTPDFSSFKSITSINGLVLKSVMVTGRSASGRLWVGVAGNGLFHRMPGDEDWRHMSQFDGLITNGVSQLGLSFARDGSVIVSNATGASIIAPAAMVRAPLDRFHLQASETLRAERIRAGEVFAIGPERRDMRIRFAVPEILEPGQYRVNYTLMLGNQLVQEADVPLGEDLIFPRLEPGNYRLTGKLASASGDQSETLTLALRVDPFWWERQSTYIWLAILLAAGIVALFYYRARSIERKFQIIADERRRIAQELHDSSLQDLFGAQMLGRALKVDGSQKDAQGTKDQVLGLLKSATTSMRESVMTLREDPDAPSLQKAIGEFEPPAALSRQVNIEYEEDGADWNVGKHRRFFVARIAQEAMNNAAKHAKANTITAKLKWSFWNLKLEVSDDGAGFDPDSPDYTSGHGREAMQCMADAVSGRLETVSEPGKGTKIRLSVPRFAL